MKPLSRSRLHQIKRNDNGLCYKCQNKLFKGGLCEFHYMLFRIHRNRIKILDKCPACGSALTVWYEANKEIKEIFCNKCVIFGVSIKHFVNKLKERR